MSADFPDGFAQRRVSWEGFQALLAGAMDADQEEAPEPKWRRMDALLTDRQWSRLIDWAQGKGFRARFSTLQEETHTQGGTA